MHSLAYQQGNKFSPTAMIYQNRREPDSTALNIDGIRAAVRAWAADCRSREFVAALIVEEWRATGGTGLDIPTDSHRQMQKVFRWIDGDIRVIQLFERGGDLACGHPFGIQR